MTETDFHLAVDAVLAARRNGARAHDALDVDLEGGVLTVGCPDASRIIINRQTPNREIWIAARSGGFHFALRDGRGATRGRATNCSRRLRGSSRRRRAKRSASTDAIASKVPENGE
jgi:CyaY protein